MATSAGISKLRQSWNWIGFQIMDGCRQVLNCPKWEHSFWACVLIFDFSNLYLTFSIWVLLSILWYLFYNFLIFSTQILFMKYPKVSFSVKNLDRSRVCSACANKEHVPSKVVKFSGPVYDRNCLEPIPDKMVDFSDIPDPVRFSML